MYVYIDISLSLPLRLSPSPSLSLSVSLSLSASLSLSLYPSFPPSLCHIPSGSFVTFRSPLSLMAFHHPLSLHFLCAGFSRCIHFVRRCRSMDSLANRDLHVTMHGMGLPGFLACLPSTSLIFQDSVSVVDACNKLHGCCSTSLQEDKPLPLAPQMINP